MGLSSTLGNRTFWTLRYLSLWMLLTSRRNGERIPRNTDLMISLKDCSWRHILPSRSSYHTTGLTSCAPAGNLSEMMVWTFT